MKYILVGLAAIIAIGLYGRSLRKKKRQIKQQGKTKIGCELVDTQEFTLEDLLGWYKSHDDVFDHDEYVLCKINYLKHIEVDKDLSGLDPNKSLVMLVFDAELEKVKHLRIVSYISVEEEVISLIEEKDFVVLE